MLNKIKSSKKLIKDFIYTFLATAVYNVVLQIIIYPLITKYLGDSLTGEIMYFVGIIYIFPQSVGFALNSARLVIHKTHDTTNGDYSRILVLFSTLSALICGVFSICDGKEWYFIVCYLLFAFIYAIRVYAQVEYRLTLDFSGYFKYFIIVSVGYLAGFGIFWIIRFWLIIFLVGEIAAVIYAFLKMDIFKKVAAVNPRRLIYENTILVIASTLIRDGVNQYDKIILKQIIGNDMVTQYSVVTMVSKVIQMFVGPVNTLILSYLTKKDAKLDRHTFRKYVLAGICAGIAAYGLSLIGTWIYLKLFYPQLFDSVIQYSFLANIGVIASFIASLYTAVILSQGKTRIYTILQASWGFTYIVLGYILTNALGLWGMAITTVITNVPKIIVAIFIAYKCLPTNSKTQPGEV